MRDATCSGTILAANPAAVKLFGYPRRDLVNKNINMLLPEPISSHHQLYVASDSAPHVLSSVAGFWNDI